MQHFLAASCTLESHPELFSWPQKTVVISYSFKLLRFGNHVMAINSQSIRGKWVKEDSRETWLRDVCPL